MLPVARRVKQKKDFLRVQRCGRRFLESNLQLQFLESGRGPAGAGFIVGTKFSKKAVERNSLKRKLREIFRTELKKIKPGTEIIVSAKGQGGQKETSETLRKKIKALLEKSNLLKKD